MGHIHRMGKASTSPKTAPKRKAKAAATGNKPLADRPYRTVTVDGNRLTLLPDGPERLDALVALIDAAKSTLRLLYYIYLPDAAGERVRQATLAAVDRGVKVSLLIDGFGSSATPEDYFVELSKRGAKFCRFNPSYGRRYLLRNHQKLALADAESARARVIVGGFNIADDYFGTIPDCAWRDIGLIVEGPAAARLAPYFDKLIDWAMSKHARMRALRHLIFEYSETRGKLQWQLGGPTAKLSPWGVSTCKDLVHSRDVEMIAAYFAPTVGDAAADCARRPPRPGAGDDRGQIGQQCDHRRRALHLRRLLSRGVQVYEYAATKLHTKLVVMDDIVHIGSSNLDIRSLYLNMELMLRVDDAEFAQLMRSYFEARARALHRGSRRRCRRSARRCSIACAGRCHSSW